MFERYTELARRAIFFARYEASNFGSHVIESEHLLLGLLREHKHLTLHLLPGGGAEEIRKEIEGRKPVRSRISTSVDLPLSRECRHALYSAAEESRRQKHSHIGNEHLLVGLLLEEQSLAAELLRNHGGQSGCGSLPFERSNRVTDSPLCSHRHLPLPDRHVDRVGGDAIHHGIEVQAALAGERTEYLNIDLVQADEAALVSA